MSSLGIFFSQDEGLVESVGPNEKDTDFRYLKLYLHKICMKSFYVLHSDIMSTTSYTDVVVGLERLATHVRDGDYIGPTESGMLNQLSVKISSVARKMRESGDPLLPKLYRNAAQLFSVSSLKSEIGDFRHDAELLSRMWKEIADFVELELKYRKPEGVS